MSVSSERVRELAADRVLWGLDEAEDREFASFGGAAQIEFDAMERVGAAVAVAFVQAAADDLAAEVVPADLMDRLRRAGDAFLASSAPRGSAVLSQPADAEPRDGTPSRPGPADRASAWVQWSGWLAAAAAAVVALVLWLDRESARTAAPPEQELAAFLAGHPDAQRRKWEVGPGGDVVWSPSAQAGYLVLDGLPANDESFQYQLWIFDRGRSTDHPVDGGVFDVAGSGRAVVPIDPKIAVDDAFGFAITKERPGGVVVSGREHVVATVGL